MKQKALVNLTGGLDTMVLLAFALNQGREVTAFTFDFGLKHKREATERIARHYSIAHRVIDFAPFKSALPGLVDKLLQMDGGMVVGQNLLIGAWLATIAWPNGFNEVWLGFTADDATEYQDAKGTFAAHLQNAISTATDGTVMLCAPLATQTKKQVVQTGKALDTPFELTATCYRTEERLCGICRPCVKRRRAFQDAGVDDPLKYQF